MSKTPRKHPLLRRTLYCLVKSLVLLIFVVAGKEVILADAANTTGTLVWNATQNRYEVTVPTSGVLSSVTVDATATFLDGHTEDITCEVKGIDWANEAQWNKLQTGYIEYGNYNGTAKNAGPMRTDIDVYIIGKFNLTVTSEDTTKGTVGGHSGAIIVGTSCTVTATAKPGYELVGWYEGTTKKSSNVSYTFTMPANNYTLKAKFKAKTYTVTFETNGGSVSPTSQSATYGSAYGTLPEPTRLGYNFAGWHKTPTGSTAPVKDTDTYAIANDTTLYAYWTPGEITVKFDPNSGSVNTDKKTVKYTEKYGSLPTPTKTGFEFVGWMLGTYQITADTIVSHPSEHTLVAKWRGKSYNITLDAGEGTLTQTTHKVYHLEPYGNLPTPTRNMYKFVGWQLDDGTYAEPDTIVTRTSPHVLTAVWEYHPTGKMVRYDDEYGDLPTPTRIGYRFINWRSNKDAANVTFGNRIVPSTIVKTANDHTIHAQWEPLTYRIIFDSNGGTPCDSITVKHGQAYNQLPVPTKEGFAFTGWYLTELNDNGYGTPIDSGNTIVRFSNNNTTQTLYAGWVDENFIAPLQVSFNTRSNVSLPPILVNYKEKYGPLPTPTKKNCEFWGWGYNLEQITENSIVKVAYDHTLVANWKIDVKFDNRGGTPAKGNSVKMTYGEMSASVSTPTKEGYTFGGYCTEIRGQGTRYYDEAGVCVHICDDSVIDKATLYAYWIQNPVITPTEPPVPVVTPKPTAAPVALRISADTPTAIITSNDGYDTQTGIPSTERIQIASTASEYHFSGTVSEVSGITQIAIKVKVPYISVWEDLETEEIHRDANAYGEKTVTIYVPRDYAFWQVDSAVVQKLTGLSIKSKLINSGKASFDYAGELKTTKHVAYTLEQHVTDPNLVLDYSDYFSKPVEAISETPGKPLTEEDIIKLLTVYAKGIAYKDTTQMNVKSDCLMVDGNVILSDSVNPRFGNASSEVSNIRPAVIHQLAKDGNRNLEVQLNPHAPNGKYSLNSYGEFQCHYAATYLGTGDSTLAVDTTPVFVHTPVVSYPTIATKDNPKATLSQPDAPDEAKDQITIDEYVEFLKLDLSDIMTGQHKEAEGYGYRSYETSNSGKQMFDCVLIKATTPFHIDPNKDSIILPNRDEWQNDEDDFHFENEIIRFTKESGFWYVHKDNDKRKIDISDISVYVLAVECLTDFEVTYGTLAINGLTGLSGYDALLATEQSADYFGQPNANTQYPSHFAYCTVPYDVNFRFITLHWYDAEEELTQVSDENTTIVTKQGYEGYFYITQFDDFEGTVKIKPSFSLVDKNGTPIEDDVLVFYSDTIKGQTYNYLLPHEDTTSKNFLAKWLNIPVIDKEFDEKAHERTKAATNSADLSQTWTLNEVEVLENSLAPHIVYGTVMEARHGMYRLPNNIKVLQRSKIPTRFSEEEREKFLSNHIFRDSVLKSDIEVDYATEGYLKVTLDVCVTFADGTPLIEYGSLPTISMYYTLGEESDGLYFQYNGVPQNGNGIDDDMYVEHVYSN